MATHTPRRALAATALLLTVLLTSCGDDGDVDDANIPTTRPTPSVAGTPGNPSTVLPTGEEICAKLPRDVVGSKLNLDITTAVPSDPKADVAPSCTYNYLNAKNKPGAAVVSALRPLDMVGRAGSEGYKIILKVVRQLAIDVDYEEVRVDAGRNAVRFTLDTGHLGICDTGNQVVRVQVPRRDAKGGEVDALLEAVVVAIG